MGSSTKQIRTILSGDYGDIKAFNYNGTGACYTFYNDGTYREIIASGTGGGIQMYHVLLTVIKGTYSLSNGILTLSNRTAEKFEHTGIATLPITDWEPVSIQSSATHSIEFGISIWDLECFTLDNDDVKYEKSE